MLVSSAVACALSLGASAQFGSAAPAPLVAQIQHPSPGFKLRPGERTDARIRVDGCDGVQWVLSLRRDGRHDALELAAGNGAVADAVVAELPAEDLVAGEKYTLVLAASDGHAMTGATAEILLTDPLYLLIPLNEGNRSQLFPGIYGSDATGNLLLYAGPSADPVQLLLLNRTTGQRELQRVGVWNTGSVQLSANGSRLFYHGWFPAPVGPPPQGGSGLGILDLGTGNLSIVDRNGGIFYSVDATGRRTVYQRLAVSNTLQYFLHDEASGSQQLTEDPQAIRHDVTDDDCPRILGTRPLISADGSIVVVITKATLGLAPSDETVGCRVFTYRVEGEEWRQIAAFPSSIVVNWPTLSADGRWLSFLAYGRSGIPPSALLLDLETSELHDPITDVGRFVTFDSVVTGDGQGIVISTQADLDPRVGNADHNLELFYYDLATRTFHQITETTGGIGSTPGGCPPYLPSVSRDGGVLAFLFVVLSVDQCHLDGPMRHERDGLIFGFTRAVRRRPGNRGPELDPIADQRALSGETLTLALAARDPEGDPVSFYAQVKDGTDVPPGSIITDHHDGTATFTWPTRPEHVGSTVLRVAAFDEGGGEVVQDVRLVVAASDRPPTPSATAPLPTVSATSATPLATASPTTAAECPSDCDGSGQVTINELLTATNIALGTAPLTSCPPAACGSGAGVTIACLTRAVGAALSGCP